MKAPIVICQLIAKMKTVDPEFYGIVTVVTLFFLFMGYMILR